MTQPQIGSVWMFSYHPYYRSYKLLTVLVLGNSIQCGVSFTRVLLIYSDGTISEESWSSSAFGRPSSAFGSTHSKYTLLYSLEEREES